MRSYARIWLFFLTPAALFLLSGLCYAFKQDDVDKLLNTKQCAWCDLGNAELSGAKLENANLADADLSGAQWTDGGKCKQGSTGECLKDIPFSAPGLF